MLRTWSVQVMYYHIHAQLEKKPNCDQHWIINEAVNACVQINSLYLNIEKKKDCTIYISPDYFHGSNKIIVSTEGIY